MSTQVPLLEGLLWLNHSGWLPCVGNRKVKGVPGQNITGVGRFLAPPCNGSGISIYQINIPAAAIFHGSNIAIPNNLVNGFNLDLYRLQRMALSF